MTAGAVRFPWLRITIAVVVGVDVLFFNSILASARSTALAHGTLSGFSDWITQPGIRTLVILCSLGGTLSFAGKPGRLWSGTIALVGLVLLSTAQAQLYGSPWRHLFYSGLCLSGWILGLAVSRYGYHTDDESYAYIGSIAFLGTAYCNAAISKIVFGGGDWIMGAPIQAVIVGQDGLVGDSLISAYRIWIVTTPLVAAFFSLATLLFEAAAPLMILARRLRVCLALGILAMHLNIYILTRILYWESMLLLLVLGLYPAESAWENASNGAAQKEPAARWFVVTAAILMVCAVAAIVHQALHEGHR